jgi:peptide/nickel transport system permease protein
MIVLGLAGTANLIRTMRANLLDELKKPYVVTARAKGLSENKLLIKYPVRVALNPFISTVGWVLPTLVSGSTVVSIVLNLPTTGPLLLRALQSQDMYLAGSFILMLSTLTVIGTLLSDILLALVDPRIRFD